MKPALTIEYSIVNAGFSILHIEQIYKQSVHSNFTPLILLSDLCIIERIFINLLDIVALLL